MVSVSVLRFLILNIKAKGHSIVETRQMRETRVGSNIFAPPTRRNEFPRSTNARPFTFAMLESKIIDVVNYIDINYMVFY